MNILEVEFNMILFRLKCSRDHEFEAWFRSSASYNEQLAHGDIDCPVCGDKHVGKAPMAPRLSSNSALAKKHPTDKGSEQRAREVARQILEATGKIRQAVEENFEYVGEDFADEARAIHYGDSEQRDIYGEATEKEAVDLDDEGIAVSRVPGPNRRTRSKN